MAGDRSRLGTAKGRSSTAPYDVDFPSMRALALAEISALCRQWLPSGRRVGSEWVARNPRRSDERLGSFKVNLVTGRWADFATGDKGGDPISLLAYLRCVSQSEAARLLRRELGERR